MLASLTQQQQQQWYAQQQQQQQIAARAGQAPQRQMTPQEYEEAMKAYMAQMHNALQAQYMQMVAQSVQVGGAVVDNPLKQLSVEDFDSNTKRTLYVQLRGSLQDFKRGTRIAEWRPRDLNIFKRIEGYKPDRTPIYKGDLTKGIFLVMKQRSLQSTFPVSLGAICDFMQGRVVTDDGSHYLFVAGPRCNKSNEVCLFEPKDPITRSALQKYNDISPAAVTSGMFVGLDGKTVFVPNQGPIGKMLHINKDELKLDFKGLSEDADGMIAVDMPIAKQCIDRYRELQTVAFKDLNDFHLRFERVAAAGDWLNPEGFTDNIRADGNGHNASRRQAMVYELNAEIEVGLVLYGDLKEGDIPLARVTLPFQ